MIARTVVPTPPTGPDWTPIAGEKANRRSAKHGTSAVELPQAASSAPIINPGNRQLNFSTDAALRRSATEVACRSGTLEAVVDRDGNHPLGQVASGSRGLIPRSNAPVIEHSSKTELGVWSRIIAALRRLSDVPRADPKQNDRHELREWGMVFPTHPKRGHLDVARKWKDARYPGSAGPGTNDVYRSVEPRRRQAPFQR